MILAAQSEAFKEENATSEMLCGLDQLMERKEDGGMYFIWVPLIGDVRTLIMDETHASSVHDTFYVSNLKNCLADASLHVPLDEIKIDKTLRFVEEPIEIMDREVRSLKRSKISLAEVRWNPKRGPKFTWEREDHMKSKYS
nr:putative reverse transcriptase domain-containing protein [Tanacetum cinerariifolium]